MDMRRVMQAGSFLNHSVMEVRTMSGRSTHARRMRRSVDGKLDNSTGRSCEHTSCCIVSHSDCRGEGVEVLLIIVRDIDVMPHSKASPSSPTLTDEASSTSSFQVYHYHYKEATDTKHYHHHKKEADKEREKYSTRNALYKAYLCLC